MYVWVTPHTSHTWRRHVMSHTWMRHVTHMNETCHTRKWDMSHTWMRRVTHVNETYHCRVTTRVLRATTPYYLNWTVDLTFERSSYFFWRSSVRKKARLSSRSSTLATRVRRASSKLTSSTLSRCCLYVWRDSLIYVIWLIHVYYMTYLCKWHDSFFCFFWFV